METPIIFEFSMPLVFACGIPTAIECMDVIKLKKFIMFLVDYMDRYTGTAHRHENWWPVNIDHCTNAWSVDEMREFIRNCYDCYDQAVLLTSSSKLADIPAKCLEYVTNSNLADNEMVEIVYLETNTTIAQLDNSLLVSI